MVERDLLLPHVVGKWLLINLRAQPFRDLYSTVGR